MSKTELWRSVAREDQMSSWSLETAIDLTVHPSSQRACFPCPVLPPHRRLTTQDLLQDFIKVPDSTWTAVGAFLSGASYAIMVRRRPSRSWQLLVTGLYSLFLFLWSRLRRPRVIQANEVMNVSSSPQGPCLVTTYALSISNSHAGTHADTPYHFSPNPEVSFDPCQYTGRAVVLDVSIALRTNGTSEISWSLLEKCAKAEAVDLDNVFRLLLCSRTYETSDRHDRWDNDFAHLTTECAKKLARLPRLFLIGVDTPSVDHPCASPICETAHGALYEGSIAIIENLDFSGLAETFHYQGAARGCVVTTFVPTEEYVDAKGCVVKFYPDTWIEDFD